MDKDLIVGSEFMPALTIQQAIERRSLMVEYVKKAMVKDVDYGVIPGTDKPTLLKPGAEKLCSLFGLTPRFRVVASVTEWGGEGRESLFFYHYSCGLYRGDYLIAEGEGSCNSHEKKYRYRWVNEGDIPAGLDKGHLKTRGGRTSEFDFAIEKGETSGQYGKPATYWQMFRDAIQNGKATRISRKTRSGKEMDAWEVDTTLYCIPNDDVAEQLNTISKIAQKRALVSAVLVGVNASEFFTQDLEDMVIEGTYTVAKVEADPFAGIPPMESESKVESPRAEPPKVENPRSQVLMTAKQRDMLIKLYSEKTSCSENDAKQGLDTVFRGQYGHGFEQTTTAEASKIISLYIGEKVGEKVKA